MKFSVAYLWFLTLTIVIGCSNPENSGIIATKARTARIHKLKAARLIDGTLAPQEQRIVAAAIDYFAESNNFKVVMLAEESINNFSADAVAEKELDFRILYGIDPKAYANSLLKFKFNDSILKYANTNAKLIDGDSDFVSESFPVLAFSSPVFAEDHHASVLVDWNRRGMKMLFLKQVDDKWVVDDFEIICIY